MKWSGLQKRVNKFAPKMFYEVDYSDLDYKHMTIINDDSSVVSERSF